MAAISLAEARQRVADRQAEESRFWRPYAACFEGGLQLCLCLGCAAAVSAVAGLACFVVTFSSSLGLAYAARVLEGGAP